MDTKRPPQSEKHLASKSEEKKHKILVIDDEARLAISTADLLSLNGHDARYTTSGQEAKRLITEYQYDLILLDLNLGDIRGEELLTFTSKRQIPTPIVIISGETRVKPVVNALKRGAYGYLKKPFSSEQLFKAVNSTLSKAHMERLLSTQRFEGLYESIIENSPDIVFVLDENGNFIFINDQVKTFLEFSSNDLLGKHYSYLIDDTDIDKANYLFDYGSTNSTSPKTAELRLKNHKAPENSRIFEISVNPTANVNINSIVQNQQAAQLKVYSLYGTAHDITERKEAEDFINFQAYHDILTRLPNRVLFKDRLKQAMTQAQRHSNKLAVVFLDLDGFKSVNDRYGHVIGDRLLQSCANRLQSCIRRCDTLSRFGGDEFTLLLPNITHQEDVVTIVQKLLESMKEPFEVEADEVSIGVSIGISLFPDHSESVEALIQQADEAMYKVKSHTKNAYHFFQSSVQTQTSPEPQSEKAIRQALRKNQLCISLRSKNPFEAGEAKHLTTSFYWNNTEEAKLYYPYEFLGSIRDNQLIKEINDWFIKAALSEARNWQKTSGNYSTIRLLIHIRQVHQSNFSQTLENVLRVFHMNQDQIEIMIDSRSLNI